MVNGETLDTASNTRWWVLALLSLLMLGNYYVYDSIGPVAEEIYQREGEEGEPKMNRNPEGTESPQDARNHRAVARWGRRSTHPTIL